MRAFRSYAATLAWTLLTIVAAIAIFFTVYNGINTSGVIGPVLIAVAVILWLAFLWRFRVAMSDDVEGLISAILEISSRAWIAACVISGLAIRIALSLLLASQPQSDALRYLTLGKQLAFEGRYESLGGWLAFWPPGLPLSLAAIFRLVGDHDWVPLLLSSLLYVASVLVVFRAGGTLFGEKAARMSSAIVAIWPSWILLSPFATKELLLILLITAAVMAYIKGRRESSLFFAGVAGFLTGAAALVHPAVVLFPAIFVIDEILGSQRVRAALMRLAVCGSLFVLAIMPWSIRNYIVLDKFVPIATNGGIALYHGNNPEATGRWTPIPSDLFGPDEVLRDRNARKAALAWISSNPTQFMKISARRFGYFLSGDDIGAYWFFERGRGETGFAYDIVSGAANLFWIVVLSLIFVAAIRRNREFPEGGRGEVSLIFGFFYGILVDTLVEGHPNHHIAYYGLLAVLASAVVRGVDVDQPRNLAKSVTVE